jgi:hypothetical protein
MEDCTGQRRRGTGLLVQHQQLGNKNVECRQVRKRVTLVVACVENAEIAEKKTANIPNRPGGFSF